MSSVAEPFSVAFIRTAAFGTLAGVHLPAAPYGANAPGTPGAVPEGVMARLHPEELAVARTLRGYRQSDWVGGRLAWAAAVAAHPGTRGQACPPLMSGDAGEPLAPEGVSLSLSHKRVLALALVADLTAGTVGIDLEDLGRDRSTVAPKVLRPEELADVAALPAKLRWPSICTRFALKEATYKAIFPHVRRYVSFQEATVTLPSNGPPAVVYHALPGEPRLSLTVAVERLGEEGSSEQQLLALVRASLTKT